MHNCLLKVKDYQKTIKVYLTINSTFISDYKVLPRTDMQQMLVMFNNSGTLFLSEERVKAKRVSCAVQIV